MFLTCEVLNVQGLDFLPDSLNNKNIQTNNLWSQSEKDGSSGTQRVFLNFILTQLRAIDPWGIRCDSSISLNMPGRVAAFSISDGVGDFLCWGFFFFSLLTQIAAICNMHLKYFSLKIYLPFSSMTEVELSKINVTSGLLKQYWPIFLWSSFKISFLPPLLSANFWDWL